MTRSSLALLAVLAGCAGGPRSGANEARVLQDRADARVRAAVGVLRELRDAPDGGFPASVARGARCVAIVPGLVHAGLLVGGRAGHGVLACRSASGWTTPRFFVLSGASAGLQVGAEKVDLVMLAMTAEAEASFREGTLQLGASTSVAAGPIGRNAQASSDLELRAPILYYSSSRGLFIGLDLTGTALEADEASARAFYGDARDFGVLLRGTRAVPPLAGELSEELAIAFPGGTVTR